jgi:hypothetical protein
MQIQVNQIWRRDSPVEKLHRWVLGVGIGVVLYVDLHTVKPVKPTVDDGPLTENFAMYLDARMTDGVKFVDEETFRLWTQLPSVSLIENQS